MTAFEAQFEQARHEFGGFDQELLGQIEHSFAPPAFRQSDLGGYDAARAANPAFRAWSDNNLAEHRDAKHAIVTVSLKAHGATPGDASAEQMRVMADLADCFGYDELRISHEQNVILPHVHKSDLADVYATLREHGLATANVGLVSDIIACPGMDYCALATARSIPIAQEIATRFDELKLEHEIGPLKIKNLRLHQRLWASPRRPHRHSWIDRAGVENYQITLGGDGTETATIGERAGPGFSADEIVPAIERLVGAYLNVRSSADETFLQTFRRLGMVPFKAVLYPEKEAAHAA